MRFDPLVPVPLLSVAAVVAAVAGWRWFRRHGADADRVGERRRWGPALRWALMGALLLIAAVDPAVAGGRATVRRSAANVLFVVDTTGSMAAEDYEGGRRRLDGVRHDLLALADEFPGAHFALVTFNSKTRVIVPWTSDRGALDSAVRLLRQEWTFYAQGTRLDEPLPTIRQLLPRAGPTGGYDVLFLLSDGEQTERPAPRSFAGLEPLVAGGAVLGYGTADGARMRTYLGRDEDTEQYIHDYATGRDAISQLDADNLADLASEIGVPYVHRTAPGSVEEIADAASADAGTVYAGERETARRLYWIPALGLVAVALWQWAVTTLEALDDRRALGRTRAARS